MRRNILITVLVLLAYTAITVLFTWPIAQQLDSGIITDNVENGDASQFIWNVYTLKQNVQEFQNPFFSDNIFYPSKANLLMHTYAPAMGFFGLLFDNNFLAVNLFLFLSFIFSAYGTFLLARKYIDNDWLSFLCGFIFSFSSYKLMHLVGHYHLILTATIPFFILLYFTAVEYQENRLFPLIKSTSRLAGCVLLFLFTILCDYYASFYILYFVGLYSLHNRFLLNARINFRSFKTWGIIAAILVVSHIVVRLLRLSGVDDKGAFWWQADLMSYFIPHTNSALYGNEYSEGLLSTFKISNFLEGVVFPGYLFILCIAFFAKDLVRGGISRKVAPLVFLSLIFFMITIPGLKVGGKQLLNLPTSILHFVPFFNNIRCPGRIFAMFMLVFPIVVFYSVNKFLPAKKYLKIGICTSLIAFFIIEYRPTPYLVFSMKDVPEAISYIRDLPAAKVVMPVPTGMKDGMKEYGKFMTKNLYYQTIHQKKMIGGYTSRMTKEALEFYQADPIMNTLLKHEKGKKLVYKGSLTDAEKFFNTFKPDVFLIYPSHRNSPHEHYILQLLKGKRYSMKEIDQFLIIELDR